jgi:hypothetical protein
MTEKRQPKRIGDLLHAIPVGGDNADLTKEQRRYIETLDSMDHVGTALGSLCFAWSALGHHIDQLLVRMLEIRDKKIANTLMANIDPRDKVRIALGVGYLRAVSGEWFETLKWCLDTIDNNLRARRNRFVHDLWHVDYRGISRIQQRTGFRKTQAFQPPEYYTEVVEQSTKEDIDALAKEITMMIIRLEFLRLGGTRKGYDWKKPLEELAPIPPRPTK